MLQFKRKKSFYEIGLDWMGAYGHFRRERFMVYSYGISQLLPYLSIGWKNTSYHYALSDKAPEVVDHIILEPFINIGVKNRFHLQKLSISLGYIQTAQQLRAKKKGYIFPLGGNIITEIKKWNVSIKNNLYLGQNLMPYYFEKDVTGLENYGNNLYFGSPFYRIKKILDSNRDFGIYDCIDLSYSYNWKKYLRFEIEARFHFNNIGYLGWQQRAKIVLNF